MAKRYEAEQLLREGKRPSEIARAMKVSVKTVIQYLRTVIGEGRIRFSDVYYTLPASIQVKLESDRKAGKNTKRSFYGAGLTSDELELYLSSSSRNALMGDLYGYLSEAEIVVHKMVQSRLVAVFGEKEDGWWRCGIPVDIRSRCAAQREQDEDPAPPFSYTNLIDLAKIIEHHWKYFETSVPSKYRNDLRLLRAHFIRFNGIRNGVMHPVKLRHWTKDDFMFVRDFHAAFVRSE